METVKCEVVGLCAIYGVKPGGDVDVPESEVARLVTGGHVVVKSAKRKQGASLTEPEPADVAETKE